MTEKQLEKKAKEYVNTLWLDEQEKENYMLTFIDGAHSRDEEIKQLKKALSSARKELFKLALRNKKGE